MYRSKNNPCTGDELLNLVQQELNSEAHNLGIYKMVRLLARKHRVFARFLDVAEALRQLDPVGVDLRRARRVKRMICGGLLGN